MRRHERLRKRKAYAKALRTGTVRPLPFRGRSCALAAIKAFEHMRQVVGRDTGARVGHADAAGKGVLAHAHTDGATGGRVLHAILEHVFQGLSRPGHVAREARVAFVVDLASHSAQVERGGERLHGPGHHLARLDAGRLHRDGPGVCLCKLEQGAYQPAHALNHPLELAQGTRANAVVVGLLRHSQGEPHGGERGAYLV